ncbi:MAG: TolC family protein [Gemmatimonadota bacterium]
MALGADAGYQSEVVEIPVPGAGIDPPPNERYEARLRADWALWDGGATGARQESVIAEAGSDQASLRAELEELRSRVSDAFFSAVLLGEQLSETRLLLEDLDARLGEARARVEEGAALPGDTAALRAELLGARLSRDRLVSERELALGLLARLTHRPLSPSTVLVLPRVEPAVHRTLSRLEDLPPGASLPDSLRSHPRFATFEAARAVQEARLALSDARRSPRIGAFGQLAWGNPGDRQFSENPHEYWRAGLQVEWRPWDWGRPDGEAREVRLRQRIIDTREAAFADALLRAVEAPVRRMAFLRRALDIDAEIIALREQVERQARAQWDERALPAWAYTDARTDVLEARLALRRHRVELVREQVRTLTILGMEIGTP